LYAEELKQKFSVFGHFYDLTIGTTVFKCRSILEIVEKGKDSDSKQFVDAVVIMMNPGSSKPADKSDIPKEFQLSDIFASGWTKEIVETKPDNAQYQIMRLMDFKNWHYVRVLNLSDLRNGNSGKFYDDFVRASKIDASNPHSIFHPKRKKELGKCLNVKPGSPIILGWGNESFLCPLTETALQSLTGYSVIGISKNDNPLYFSYPSPYLKVQKLHWLDNILKLLKK